MQIFLHFTIYFFPSELSFKIYNNVIQFIVLFIMQISQGTLE